MKNIALALVALSAVATPAFAQDGDATYTGAHVSVIAGYDQLNLNTDGLDNPSGVLYGVNLGYDIQSGSALFGIEAEAAESTAEIKVGNVVAASAGRDLYVGGRIGYVAGETLVYAKAGYTNARVETVAGNENGDGLRLGLGAERKFGSNFFGKIEYRYSNYEADVERHQVAAGLGFRF